ASAAMLVKYSNIGALAMLLAAIIIARRRRRAAQLITLLFCAVVPLTAWMLRCQLVLGDWTAVRVKATELDWTPLTWSQSLQHPILRPLGMIDFLSRLCVTFWRGELFWNNSIQRLRWADWFYCG